MLYGSNFSDLHFTLKSEILYLLCTCEELGVIRICKVEALQAARDTREVLPAPRVSCLQHPPGAGDLCDQHAPVSGQSHEASHGQSVLPAGC